MPDQPKPTSGSKWEKAPESLVTFFLEVVKDLPGAESRKMFGYPCAFANGQMFSGLFGDKMFIRLPDEERTAFQKIEGVCPFEPIPGRPMREYCLVPDGLLNNTRELNLWLAKSLAYARSLPLKVKKKRSVKK